MGILVVGMHRSGTSLVGRLLDSFGLEMGEGPLMEAAPDNPRGFFERTDIAEFNDAWLSQAGGSVWSPPIQHDIESMSIEGHNLAAARGGLDVFEKPNGRWFVKDPRISLLMSIWDRLALQSLPALLCVRPPLEVAESLRLRNGIPIRTGVALWYAYNAAVVETSSQRQLAIIDYPSMIASARPSVEALHGLLVELGLMDDSDWDPDLAVSLVEPDLHRSERTASDDLSAIEVSEANDAYETLAKLHMQIARPTIHVPAWVEYALVDVRERERLARMVTDLQSQLRGLEQQPVKPLSSSQAALAAPEDELKLERSLTQQLRMTIDFQRRALAALSAELGVAKAAAIEADRIHDAEGARIEKAREEERQRLETQLAQTNELVNSMVASRSWRLGRMASLPVRRMRGR